MPFGKWNFSGFRLLADYYPDFLIPYFGSWSTSSSKSSSTSICCHSDQLISLVIYIEILLTMLWSNSSPLTSICRSSTPVPQSPPYVNGSCAGASPQSDDVRNNDNPELSGQRGPYDMTPHCLMSTLVPSIGHLSHTNLSGRPSSAVGAVLPLLSVSLVPFNFESKSPPVRDSFQHKTNCRLVSV